MYYSIDMYVHFQYLLDLRSFQVIDLKTPSVPTLTAPRFWLLIAASGHDLGHLGHNGRLKVAGSPEIAICPR